MAIRSIRLDGDELLRKKSKEVKEITPNVLTLLDDMADTMYEKDGVGLAAPQVGALKRIVIIDIGDEEGLIEMINPEILECTGSQTNAEGCLSVPGKSGVVDRPTYVKAKATDRNGNDFIVEGEGLMAVALCHEIDHLDGILYTDKVIEMEDEEEYEDEYEDDYEEVE